MNFLQPIRSILLKDLLLEWRNKDILVSMLVFSLTVVIIFNFVFDPGSPEMQATVPGILWVAFVFASQLGLSRSFAREQENGRMHGLLLCPVDRSLIFTAKMLSNLLFILLVEVVTLPVMTVLFDLRFHQQWPHLLLVLGLGAWGLATVGTLFSAIAANTRSREVMLPILLFPVSVPIILASIKSTSYLLSGRNVQDIAPWIRLLIAFDVIYFVVCYLLYEYVVEE